jgi:hypothetical protein
LFVKFQTMRYFLFSLASILLFVFSCKHELPVTNEMNVTGYLKNYTEAKVVLYGFENGAFIPFDSVYMTKGKFIFNHIKLQSPELMYLSIDNSDIIIEFFGECSSIGIYADSSKNSKVEVVGSKTHDEYLTFLENNSVFENKTKEIQKQREYAKSVNDLLFLNELDSIYQNVIAEQLDFSVKYVRENPGSFVSLFILSQTLIDMIDVSEIELLKLNLKDTLKYSIYYKELNEFVNTQKNIQAGKQAPDFSLPDSSGIKHSLSSLQQSNVILYFGASWNNKTVGDIHIMKKLIEQFKNKELKTYNVFIESHRIDWLEFLKHEKPEGISVSDIKGLDSEVIKLYGIRSLPEIMLLNKHGIIIRKNIETEELNELLNDL